MESQPPLSTDETWLRLAVEEAKLAQDAGEVPVGAILLHPDGTILAHGQNRVIRDHDPTAHAEIVAMRDAGSALGNYRLEGCTLYVTLEPCAMCAGAMIHARLARLVFGALDPKAGAVGSVLDVLNHPRLNHQIEFTNGLLAEECGDLLRRFFQSRRDKPAG
jgi:tRNA(adenine34) deaminase